MQRNVIVVGAGGHAKVIADILKVSGDRVLGFLDDKAPEQLPGFHILGSTSDICSFPPNALFVPAFGNNHARQSLMEKNHVNWCSAIHPTAVLAEDVTVGPGTVIMANAVVNSGTKIGKGVIINTGATVDHDCTLEDYVHVSPGAHLAGTVSLGRCSWVGIGGIIINNINVCRDVVLGAGAVVVKDITEPGVYIGIPSSPIKADS
ncbi:MAG: NeuD/PglB/VioB family sugar acetyltransferase [Bacillota bacterium]|nr:NeuD/PglB/VioB family sugar acetyltransferase [Bacillota bacterium]